MSIAVDQTRLRRIVETLRAGEALDRAGAMTILEIAQLAAGVGPEDDPVEHATLQAVAQHVGSIAGMKPGELLAIPPLPDEEARAGHLALLASQLPTRAARELAYAVAFLVSVADLELTPAERTALEEFQHALGLDYRRATDLVVLVSEIVDAGDTAA
jgi:tellurite resistance protein